MSIFQKTYRRNSSNIIMHNLLFNNNNNSNFIINNSNNSIMHKNNNSKNLKMSTAGLVIKISSPHVILPGKGLVTLDILTYNI